MIEVNPQALRNYQELLRALDPAPCNDAANGDPVVHRDSLLESFGHMAAIGLYPGNNFCPSSSSDRSGCCLFCDGSMWPGESYAQQPPSQHAVPGRCRAAATSLMATQPLSS
eukprot:gnl/TRDRNA2_/TRDRNA2_72658_c0_seq1.p3 gnl/TRDRNA2_/TRDRNA2_72658_c0~~gnl/TRDRNA2_/TRDRNA2_72658_c0_seq1.p3  ORF type:complete len:112 (-),score=28.96 gnl/TRDRNA2_/TRDRNA2_72658_c0_seq1:1-336(-)